MSIELCWDDTIPNVIHYRFYKGWTWEEFRQTALREHALGEGLNGERYDIIGDLTLAAIPRGTPYTNVSRLFEQGPHNRQMIILVGSNLAGAMILVAGRIYPRTKGRFHAEPTVEAARQSILYFRGQAVVK